MLDDVTLSLFWSKVDKAPGHGPNGDCWIWTGARGHRGYGRIWKRMATHIVLIQDGRPKPDGLFALHSCDNPPCCNPKHLRWGTHAENVEEMLTKRRHHGQRKTHCMHGHPLSGKNLRLRPNGQRQCKTCHLRDAANHRERQRSKRLMKEASK